MVYTQKNANFLGRLFKKHPYNYNLSWAVKAFRGYQKCNTTSNGVLNFLGPFLAKIYTQKKIGNLFLRSKNLYAIEKMRKSMILFLSIFCQKFTHTTKKKRKFNTPFEVAFIFLLWRRIKMRILKSCKEGRGLKLFPFFFNIFSWYILNITLNVNLCFI